jgi:preprotein translocase subunit SecG
MATTILLIVHLFVTLALIGVVLIQRSEGGGLGIGSSQGMGGFMSGRGTANLLTRTTAILATVFMGLSLALALLNRGTTVNGGSSILDVPPSPTRAATPVPTPVPPAPAPRVAVPANTAPQAAPEATPPATPQSPAPVVPQSTAPAAPQSPAAAAPAAPAPASPAPATAPAQR